MGSPPRVRHVSDRSIELLCRISDLEYRLVEYVVEIRHCNGPYGAAPSRVYFARLGEQSKVDDVSFAVPRHRGNEMQALWEPHGVYQFRVIGRYKRGIHIPLTSWQVASEWSDPVTVLL